MFWIIHFGLFSFCGYFCLFKIWLKLFWGLIKTFDHHHKSKIWFYVFPVKQICTLKPLLVQATIYFNTRVTGTVAQAPLLQLNAKSCSKPSLPFSCDQPPKASQGPSPISNAGKTGNTTQVNTNLDHNHLCIIFFSYK